MASKAARCCRECRVATRNANGYCDKHQKLAVGWVRSQKGKTTTERGYGWVWQKQRKLALYRDSYLCVPCRVEGRIATAVDVDHIVSKSEGGGDELSNLQSICLTCHKKKTDAESKRGVGKSLGGGCS